MTRTAFCLYLESQALLYDVMEVEGRTWRGTNLRSWAVGQADTEFRPGFSLLFSPSLSSPMRDLGSSKFYRQYHILYQSFGSKRTVTGKVEYGVENQSRGKTGSSTMRALLAVPEIFVRCSFI